MDIGGLLPRLHPGRWLKSVGEIETRDEITYDEIIKNSTTGILPETKLSRTVYMADDLSLRQWHIALGGSRRHPRPCATPEVQQCTVS